MALLDLMKRLPADKVPPLVGGWRQFVLDHLSYIAQRSRSYDITPEVMNLYRYDLIRFLTDRLQRKQNISQIVLLLNNMDSDLMFKNPGVYSIPEDSVIESLYSSYLTTVTNRV